MNDDDGLELLFESLIVILFILMLIILWNCCTMNFKRISVDNTIVLKTAECAIYDIKVTTKCCDSVEI